MMDVLVDKVIEALSYELMRTNSDGASAFYTDKFIEVVTNKSITATTPSLTIAVVEGDSRPLQFEISSTVSQTAESYSLQIQFIVRAAAEAEAKQYRRIVTQRIKHAILRTGGKFRALVLGAVDTDEGYRENVQKYKTSQTRYDNSAIAGEFIYLSVIELDVETQVSYNEPI